MEDQTLKMFKDLTEAQLFSEIQSNKNISKSNYDERVAAREWLFKNRQSM